VNGALGVARRGGRSAHSSRNHLFHGETGRMKRLLAATATLSLLAAAGPALAAPARYAACKAPAGATLVKPGATADSSPTTPVGALNETSEQAGTFVLDLSGKPTSAAGKLTFTLSWENPVSDYDLVVAGTNEEGVDNPEVLTFKAKHCKPVPVEIAVFLGVPADDLSLSVKGS
jgi:hypothetical protein